MPPQRKTPDSRRAPTALKPTRNDLTKTKRKFLKTQHNGQWICTDFQYKNCKSGGPGKYCAKGKHTCAVELKSNAACGRDHPGVECPSLYKD